MPIPRLIALAVCLIALPVEATDAGPLEISVLGDKLVLQPDSIRLVVEPSQDNFEQALEPVEILVEVGETVVQRVPSGFAWRVRTDTEGAWSSPRSVFVDASGASVRIDVYPVADLLGVVRKSEATELPEVVSLEFESAPDSVITEKRRFSTSCRRASEEIRCQIPAVPLDLRLKAAGFAPIYLWGVAPEPYAVTPVGLLEFRRGASVVGRVEAEDDAVDLSGTKVRLDYPRFGRGGSGSVERRLSRLALQTKVNERGFFQFTTVPAGEYELTVSLKGYAEVRRFPVEAREGLEANLTDPIVLRSPARLLLGITPPLAPYGGAWRIRLDKIEAQSNRSEESFEGEVSLAGEWSRAGLQPGSYVVRLSGEHGSTWLERELEVESPETTAFLEIPLVEVRGLVRIGTEPLPATVWFGGKDGGQRVRFDSDNDGEFAGFLSHEGSWPVEIESRRDGLRLAIEPIKVELGPGKRRADIEITVPDTMLSGDVVDENDTPVSSADILIGTGGGKPPSRHRSDEDGAFVIRGLPGGQVSLQARGIDQESDWVHIQLQENHSSPPVKLVLRKQLKLTGYTQSQTGPVPGATIMVWPRLSQNGGASLIAGAVADPRGRFTVSVPASAGQLSVAVFARGYALRLMNVELHREGDVEVWLGKEVGRIVLRLPSDDPRTGAPAPILYYDEVAVPVPMLQRWIQIHQAQSTVPGVVVIPALEPGNYSACLVQDTSLQDSSCASGFLVAFSELVLDLG